MMNKVYYIHINRYYLYGYEVNWLAEIFINKVLSLKFRLSHFEAEITFHLQGMSWNHFLARGKLHVTGCIVPLKSVDCWRGILADDNLACKNVYLPTIFSRKEETSSSH